MANDFQETYELLQKRNLLFSQCGEVYSVYGYVYWNIKQDKGDIRYTTGRSIIEDASRMGFVPSSDDLSHENVHAAYDFLNQKDQGYVKKALFFLPFEAQDLLNFVIRHFGARNARKELILKENYKQARTAIRASIWAYMGKWPKGIQWNNGEMLEDAVVKQSVYFDTFYYAYKEADLHYLNLVLTWLGAVENGDVVCNRTLASFLIDPAMPEFLADYPDFTYDKLADLAIKNRDAWEKQHGRRLPDDERVTEEFAQSFYGLGRSF